jgi:hypothetical protein
MRVKICSATGDLGAVKFWSTLLVQAVNKTMNANVTAKHNITLFRFIEYIPNFALVA